MGSYLLFEVQGNAVEIAIVPQDTGYVLYLKCIGIIAAIVLVLLFLFILFNKKHPKKHLKKT